MTYAIIEAGGKQLRVEPGRFYDINLLPIEAEEGYSIDKVLLISNDGDISVGQPYVANATVEGRVLSHLRGRKVIVYKMRPKKKTRKKRGHRQELSRLLITAITLNGETLAAADEEVTTAEVEVVDTPETADTAAE
ncbi:MAG: 50S ribosomal protein L21 [Jaaginema sp. PMC 1079.18]|nr:50S ribosomal protein L21 [Jaaginema sp. PMC 1080.18]MEC4851744.1 50S ribosomal protein L21 [Jaaginema sp. PMC 1079.18]MEC4864599.1 50S ribosomal protein L21 [Jaaginema sp. PMC 1078.18]